MTASERKVRENRLRRMATKQGLGIHKYRTRDPQSITFGMYFVFGLEYGSQVSFERITLDEVEAFLGQDLKTRNAIWFSQRAQANMLD
jgi:hypothetical protein